MSRFYVLLSHLCFDPCPAKPTHCHPRQVAVEWSALLAVRSMKLGIALCQSHCAGPEIANQCGMLSGICIHYSNPRVWPCLWHHLAKSFLVNRRHVDVWCILLVLWGLQGELESKQQIFVVAKALGNRTIKYHPLASSAAAGPTDDSLNHLDPAAVPDASAGNHMASNPGTLNLVGM